MRIDEYANFLMDNIDEIKRYVNLKQNDGVYYAESLTYIIPDGESLKLIRARSPKEAKRAVSPRETTLALVALTDMGDGFNTLHICMNCKTVLPSVGPLNYCPNCGLKLNPALAKGHLEWEAWK